MARLTPAPQTIPSSADWEYHRNVITHLYMDEKLDLSKVVDKMKNTYGFVATQKMYKYRFKKWELSKYYHGKDVEVILESLLQSPDQAGSALFHNGRPVRLGLIRRRVGNCRRGLANAMAINEALRGRKRSLPPGMNQDLPLARPMTGHGQVRNMETTLIGLDHYLTSYFDSPKGMRYLDRNQSGLQGNHRYSTTIHPAELNQSHARAVKLFSRGYYKFAFQLMERASSPLNVIFSEEHPALLTCLLDTFTSKAPAGHEAAQEILFKYIVFFAERVLGTLHPLTNLCMLFQQGAQDGQVETFWQHYSTVFGTRLGFDHRVTVYVNQKLFENLLETGKYTEAEKHADKVLAPVFANAKQSPTPAYLCYLRRRARLYRCQGRLILALNALVDLLDIIQTSLCGDLSSVCGNPTLEEIFRVAEEIALFYKAIGDYGHAIDLRFFAADVCIAVRGLYDSKTRTMVSSLEEYIIQHGDLELTARLAPYQVPDSERVTQMLSCSICANERDTQEGCLGHRPDEGVTDKDVRQFRSFFDQLIVFGEALIFLRSSFRRLFPTIYNESLD